MDEIVGGKRGADVSEPGTAPMDLPGYAPQVQR